MLLLWTFDLLAWRGFSLLLQNAATLQNAALPAPARVITGSSLIFHSIPFLTAAFWDTQNSNHQIVVPSAGILYKQRYHRLYLPPKRPVLTLIDTGTLLAQIKHGIFQQVYTKTGKETDCERRG